MAYLSQLYCDECVINGCLTNSEILAYLKAIDAGDEPMPHAVDLSHNYLGNRGISALCVVLSTLPSIESLDLRKMDVQIEGVNAVCKLAKRHQRLQRIDLRGNQLFASSGRALVDMLKVNPRVTHCLIDLDTMPERFVRAINSQIGRNIAAQFPCTWDGCAEEAASIEVFPPEPNFVPSELTTTFQHEVAAELDGCVEQLLDLYRRCGLMVCQFFVDFGPGGLNFLEQQADVFALESNGHSSRDFCLGNEPVWSHVKALLGAEVAHYRGSATVQEVVVGSLLENQLESAMELLDKLASDAQVNDCIAIVMHARNALRNLRSPALVAVEDDASAARKDVTRHLEQSRKLQLLHHEARYLRMDYPDMDDQAAAVYACCQSPLRVAPEELKEQVLRRARPAYAPKRRSILSRLLEIMPPELMAVVFRHWAAGALDASASADGLHVGVVPALLDSPDWVTLVDRHLSSAAAASKLVEHCAGARRLEGYRAM